MCLCQAKSYPKLKLVPWQKLNQEPQVSDKAIYFWLGELAKSPVKGKTFTGGCSN